MGAIQGILYIFPINAKLPLIEVKRWEHLTSTLAYQETLVNDWAKVKYYLNDTSAERGISYVQ